MTKPGDTDTGRQEIPQTMNAAAIDEFGPPAVLALHQLRVPKPGPREVLISLHAAGVGSWDGLVRDGSWRPWGPNPRFPSYRARTVRASSPQREPTSAASAPGTGCGRAITRIRKEVSTPSTSPLTSAVSVGCRSTSRCWRPGPRRRRD